MKVSTVIRAAGLACFAAATLAATGCTNDQTLTNSSTFNGTFYQIDREPRPLVEELYTVWGQHDYIARSSPASDAGTLSKQVLLFMTGSLAHRSTAISTYVQNLFSLAPPQPPAQFPTMANVLVADVSQPGPAHYLGIETGGHINYDGSYNPTPSTSQFGGRALTDDVMAITLELTFGSLVPEISGIPDDGQEQDGRNGRPNLANDNVTSSDKHFQLGAPYLPLAFPYLGPPVATPTSTPSPSAARFRSAPKGTRAAGP